MKKVSDKTLRAYFERRYPDEARLVDLMVQAMHDRVELDTTYYQSVHEDKSMAIPFAHDSQYGKQNKFAPTIHFEKFADHIGDWLRAAIATKKRWIEPHEAFPNEGSLRLKQAQDLGSIGNMANKDMKEFNDRMRGLVSLGIDEKTVMKFDDGYRIVELTSPLALDAEGAHMNNCTGMGSYDKKLAEETHRYYSLRDAQNKPHVTFEVQVDKNLLIQLEGKANQPPRPKYMRYVVAFALKQKLALGGHGVSLEKGGLFEQDGKYYNVYDLPDGFCFSRWHSQGDLDLSGLPVERLPENFKVKHHGNDTRFATLRLGGTLIRHLPDGLEVDGDLHDTQGFGGEGIVSRRYEYRPSLIETVGKRTRIRGSLNLCGSHVRTLPDDLVVGGGCSLPPTLEGLPENFSVGGRCEISGIEFMEWMDDKTLPKKAFMPLPAGMKIGYNEQERAPGLVLAHLQNVEFPIDMQVHGELTVRHCDRLVVPARTYDVEWFNIRDVGKVEMAEGITVMGKFILEGKEPRTLPENLTVHGDLDISRSAITKLPASLIVHGKINLPPQMLEVPKKPVRGISPAAIIEQRAQRTATQRQ